MRTPKINAPFFLIVIFLASMAAGFLLVFYGPQRPPAPAQPPFTVPDSCLVVGDTLTLVDHRTPVPGEGEGSLTWPVGDRRVLLTFRNDVERSPLYIRGVVVGILAEKSRRIYRYLRVKPCGWAPVPADLRKEFAGRKISWQ